ncbi:MAG TPA: glycoside hydrolase family 3 N-terminal domain-containing protein [Candidatus Limnocylindria bacterium]
MTAPRPSFVGRPSRAAVVALCLLLVSAAQPAMAARVDVPPPRPKANLLAAVPLSALIGQKLVVAMHGTAPSTDLLGRIERGEVGGVILFGANIRSAVQLARITRRLQAAASGGGQPRLLITTDQEGGLVRRLPWAPPTLSPPQMGALGSTSVAFAQGRATGHTLACAGVNGNLAPVADVPKTTDSFLYRDGRTWSFDAATTARLADAFARGAVAGSNVPAMKHFPGLGRATRNTDSSVVTLGASAAQLAPDLKPYRTAIGHDIPMIMLSNATYRAYDRYRAAGWSRAISIGLLRDTLGFRGVSITDSLNGTAAARGVSPTSLAVKAAVAGTDMILLTGSESASSATYRALLNAALAGDLPTVRLRASYERILALKAALPPRVSDHNPPNVVAPASTLPVGVTLGGTTVPVRTAWSATDGCRIAAYALQRRTGTGAWVSQALPGSLSSAIVQGLHFGIRYRYASSATDGAGNASDGAFGPSFRARRIQEDDAAIRYRGGWHLTADPLASGDGLAASTVAGATATFAFTGSSVSWVAVRGPARGSAAVYVDGAYAGRVNLHAATRQDRQLVFARSWTESGAHRIRVVNLGTSGHPRIDVDAFVTLFPA